SHSLSVASDSSTLIKLADGREQPAAGLIAAAPVAIGSYSDTIDLTITDLSGYDIILGMSWLHHYNPTIDWRGSTIAFTDAASRRHLLRTAATGPALWQPTRRSTHAATIKLIPAKCLRRAYDKKQIEFACVVYAQDGQLTGPNPGSPAASARELMEPNRVA